MNLNRIGLFSSGGLCVVLVSGGADEGALMVVQ